MQERDCVASGVQVVRGYIAEAGCDYDREFLSSGCGGETEAAFERLEVVVAMISSRWWM